MSKGLRSLVSSCAADAPRLAAGRFTPFFFLILVHVIGCSGGSDDDADADAGTDAAEGTVSDASTGADGDTDTDSDTDTDTDTDTDADADADADADIDADADVDGDADADVDADVDADADADADAGYDAAFDSGADAGVLDCLFVEPDVASTLVENLMMITGAGFQDGMTVSLVENMDGGIEVNLGTADVMDPSSASIDILAGTLDGGTFSVRLENPNMSSVICPDSIDLLGEAPPSVIDVRPPTAWQGDTMDKVNSDQPVVVEGSEFRETPMVVWIKSDDTEQRYPADIVLYNDMENLDGICPSESGGMPLGFYYVQVINPSGLSAFWTMDGGLGEFEVTDIPPPDIQEIDPVRSPAASQVNLSVYGDYFQDGGVVQIVQEDGTLEELETFYVDRYQLDALIPADIVDVGVYPVRVTNPDNRYDIFYSYAATPSSAGHLDPEGFEMVDGGMTTPRWRHAAAEGYDLLGGTYIYVAGGLDADGGVLDSVEVLPVSMWGNIGDPWIAEQWIDENTPRISNTMNLPRQGLTMVRAGAYLYAIGGSDVNTAMTLDAGVQALDSVEKARILNTDTRPREVELAWLPDGGMLEKGVWYYQVSAVGPWGESLASPRRMIAGGPGSVHVSWNYVFGATGYNIYRNPDPSGNRGQTRLVAGEVDTLFYDDDGTVVPDLDGGVSPLPPGSLGWWHEVDNASLLSGREGADAVVVTVPNGMDAGVDPTFIYVTGGRPNASGTGYFTDTERARVYEDGGLGGFEYMSENMNTARAFYVLITNQGQGMPAVGPVPEMEKSYPFGKSPAEGPLYLIAVWGDDEYDGAGNSGTNSFEVAGILAPDAGIGPWTTQGPFVPPVPAGRKAHGHGAFLYFDYLFAFHGVMEETVGSDPTPDAYAASRFEYWEGSADPADVLRVFQSAGADFVENVCYYDMLRFNGYIWRIGGNDGSGPVDSIERIQQ